MFLYSILLFFTLFVPIILSFDKKLKFYKKWKFLFPSLFIVALFFISKDVYFTEIGVWGFNPNYTLNIFLLGLPIEEFLFFFVIPYASIFLHESVILCFPNFKLTKMVSTYITVCLILLSTITIILSYDKVYTVYAFSILITALLFSFLDRGLIVQRYYLTFLIILIPFVIVDGILTGSCIEDEVVWYNNNENLGLRFFTIPVEDFAYGFSLIFFNIFITNRLMGNRKVTGIDSVKFNN